MFVFRGVPSRKSNMAGKSPMCRSYQWYPINDILKPFICDHVQYDIWIYLMCHRARRGRLLVAYSSSLLLGAAHVILQPRPSSVDAWDAENPQAWRGFLQDIFVAPAASGVEWRMNACFILFSGACRGLSWYSRYMIDWYSWYSWSYRIAHYSTFPNVYIMWIGLKWWQNVGCFAWQDVVEICCHWTILEARALGGRPGYKQLKLVAAGLGDPIIHIT